MLFVHQVGIVGNDQTIVLPVIDARTNGMAVALVGPRDTRNNVRWFVRLPRLEDAERFPCPVSLDRRSIRFDPVLLYVDAPVPARTSLTLQRVTVGTEQGRIEKKVSIGDWKPTAETLHHPALRFHLPTCAPAQIIEFLGTSWWRRGPSKKRVEPWEDVERGPPGQMFYSLSVWCLFRMSWLPAEGPRMKFRFANGRATEGIPTAPLPPPPPPTGGPVSVEGSQRPVPPPIEEIEEDPLPSSDE